jgi:hypothetical protein
MDSGAANFRSVLVRLAVYMIVGYTGLIVFSPLFYALTDTLLAAVLATFAAAAAANSLALRIYERRTLAAVGLGWNRESARHLALGLAGGLGTAIIVVGIPLLTGLAVLESTPGPTAGWPSLLFTWFLLLFGVVGEELLFRGYGFQVMLPLVGEFATLLPMGVLFAAAHASNLNVSPIALFNTFAWGVVLGWAVLKSGDLWLASGIHAGWNWALPLFGVNLSGFKMKLTGYSVRWQIGDLWSGGGYGPEGGLICLLVLVLLIQFLRLAPIRQQTLVLRRKP